MVDNDIIEKMISKTPRKFRNYTVYHYLLSSIWQIHIFKSPHDDKNDVAIKSLAIMKKYHMK